jgi:hypothetical protein
MRCCGARQPEKYPWLTQLPAPKTAAYSTDRYCKKEVLTTPNPKHSLNSLIS